MHTEATLQATNQSNTQAAPQKTALTTAFSKAKTALKKHVWLLAAFLIPLTIRSIPEILSYPYPLGLDTLTMVKYIDSGSALLSGPLVFLKTQLYYPIATLVNWLVGDPIVVTKIFGPLLMGSVAVMMFLYAKRGLRWSDFKSFLVALLVAIYFVSLRNSWDLYAQSFGLVFLFATLIILKSSNSAKRYAYAFPFMLLTVLCHQLISVLLLFFLGLEALRFLVKRSHKDLAFSLCASGLAGCLFLFRTYSPERGNVAIPAANVASDPSVDLIMNTVTLLVYCYVLISPLVIIGFTKLKDWVLRYWVIWCLGVPVLLMFFPNLPLYYWNRWVYLLVYPLLFFAVEGLDRLWTFKFSPRYKIKRLAPKVLAVTYVTLLLALFGFYLIASPDNQISFFGSNNPCLAYIPSSMLQNMVPIADNSGLVSCIDWIRNTRANDSVVISHYALYDLIQIYGVDYPLIAVRQGSMLAHLANQTTLADGMVEASKHALAAGNSTVYTIWWVDEDGWYGIPVLPNGFSEVYRVDRMAVYVFD